MVGRDALSYRVLQKHALGQLLILVPDWVPNICLRDEIPACAGSEHTRARTDARPLRTTSCKISSNYSIKLWCVLRSLFVNGTQCHDMLSPVLRQKQYYVQTYTPLTSLKRVYFLCRSLLWHSALLIVVPVWRFATENSDATTASVNTSAARRRYLNIVSA